MFEGRVMRGLYHRREERSIYVKTRMEGVFVISGV